MRGLLVGTRFQVLFHSPRRGAFHLSLTVLVHYRSQHVFSLSQWTGSLQTGLACPVLLRCPTQVCFLYPTGLSPSPVRRSRPVRVEIKLVTCCYLKQSDPITPIRKRMGLGCSAFARHYLRNTLFSSGYLDVSVLPVPFPQPIDSVGG